jgi:tol-pal system protein YbgF
MWLMAAAGAAVLLTGCLAQQADLAQMERSLGGRIARLDQREKELQAAIKQAKQDVDKLVSETRARMSQEITVLREEDLPSIRGVLDKEAHQIVTLRARLEDLEDRATKALTSLAAAEQERKAVMQQEKAQREQLQQDLAKLNARLDAMPGTIGTMVKTLGTRLDEQDKTLRADEARSAAVAQQLDNQGRTVSEQIAQFSRALSDFRKALQGLSDKVTQEDQVGKAQALQLSHRLDTLQGKVENDAKATSAHLNEVNKSVGSVAKAVETMGSRFVSRLDEQDRRLEQVTSAVQAVAAQANTLTQAVSMLQETPESPRSSQGQPGHKRGAASERDGARRQSAPERTSPSAQPLQSSIAGTAALAVAAPSNDSQADGKAMYELSLKKLQEGQLDAAQQGFSEFLADHPASDLAPNARYWLGECYYGKKEYQRAIEAFDRLKTEHPRSGKVPAALLKKGFAYLALNDSRQATVALRQVMDGYPRSAEAEKAAQKLAHMRPR